MELAAKYNPAESESKWYQYWLDEGLFHSEPDDRDPYTIVIPPPNVTGVLHMGHMLNNTIQDVLIRRARMMGYNACWVPGTDHASIATEAKVVRKLREEGIKKSDIGREEFLKHAFEWKEEYGGVILEQLKKLGASCDWDRTRFTMDNKYYESVIDTFIDLFDKGKIYRGKRMINWDPAAKTALSDEEVIYKEVDSKLYHVRYQVAGTEEWLTIATTRPETILGDTAICIHPDDTRYTHLHGKKAIVPLVNREIPVILDDYVDMEFGTGCLKVTPAHDPNDFDLGNKHNLESIDIMNPDGTLSEEAQMYIGEDRFEVRKKIEADLEAAGHLVKVEDYVNNVGFSERTDVVIEPRLSLQWWVKMEELAAPALKAVEDGDINFHPAKFKNTYKHWMSNIKDWCISRQLWWGHRIPAWYYGEGEDDFVVAKNISTALEKAKAKSGDGGLSEGDLSQDEDVLDTWFSSWLWPISVFDGFYDDTELNYYYPTASLVTGPDIIFFWVARMIMAGYEYKGNLPFKDVYFTGIVRDSQGRKMSKQLGNSPDPIALINEYGADGVRVGLLLTTPAGNDIPFDPKLCEQGRNFSNKIWNALRLIKGWEVDENAAPTKASKIAANWFENVLANEVQTINESFDQFRLSEGLMGIYKLIWDEFCSWYLEMIKPDYQRPIDRETLEITLSFFEQLVKLIHPFMPFLSEEIWQQLYDRDGHATIMTADWPKGSDVDQEALNAMEFAKEVIAGVRTIRNDKGIAKKDALELYSIDNEKIGAGTFPVITRLANLSVIHAEGSKPDGAFGFRVKSNEYFVPLGDAVDMDAEKEKLEKELEYNKGFMQKLQKKLSNENFVNNAPEQVVAMEKKKLSDAEAKIKVIEEQLEGMG